MSEEKKTESEEVPSDPPKKRNDEDTLRHTLVDMGSKAQFDLAESAKALQEAAEQSSRAARSLILESRRTRMASRPGMKSPYAKK